MLRSTFLALAIGMACVLGAPAARSATLDQVSAAPSDFGAFLEDVSGSLGENAYQTQTFTVGLTGILDSFEVELGLIDPVAGTVHFQVYSTTPAGLPDLLSTPLAEVDLAYDLPGDTSEFFLADIRSFGVPVTAGDVLALVGVTGSIVSTSGDPTVNWVGSSADPYAGGRYNAFFASDLENPVSPLDFAAYDLNFRTYVDVPEPATGALLALGLLGAALARSRRERMH